MAARSSAAALLDSDATWSSDVARIPRATSCMRYPARSSTTHGSVVSGAPLSARTISRRAIGGDARRTSRTEVDVVFAASARSAREVQRPWGTRSSASATAAETVSSVLLARAVEAAERESGEPATSTTIVGLDGTHVDDRTLDELEDED